MKIIRGGSEIRTLEQWRDSMPPRLRDKQWKEGRSAMELARAWVLGDNVVVPEELQRLLETNSEFSGTTLVEGRPEEETRLDDFRGMGRVSDLLLIGERAGERVVISVEAKADESFGPTVDAYIAKERPEESNAPARVQQLSRAVFGVEAEHIGSLRYQLLHAVAGTLIAAKDHGAGKALFLVHEFLTATDRLKVERNESDLSALLQLLGWQGEFGAGRIAGPFHVPGGGLVPSDVELYVGKVERGG